MATLRDLLENGYRLANADINGFYDSKIDYDGEIGKEFICEKNKTIMMIPTIPDITPLEIMLDYKFSDEVVECYMNFEDDEFTITYDGDKIQKLDQSFIFDYNVFAEYIKDKLGVKEEFSSVHLRVICTNSRRMTIEYHAWYVGCSFKNRNPELYSGIEVYCDCEEVAYINTIILYGLNDIEDLKSKIRIETKYYEG